MALHMTLYHIHAERRLYHHQKSLSLWSPWNAPTAGHPDRQLVRSGCHNWGSLGEEGGCEGGRPPAPLSITPVCLCSSLHLFLLTLCGVSVVPVSGLHRAQQQTWPVPIHLLLLLISVTRCLPAVPSGKCCVRYTGYFHLALGNFHFLNVFISRAFVHSPAAWLVMGQAIAEP